MWELARLFLRLGATAFGGPAAHVAMMHDEVVTRRRWMSEQDFLDLLGATNLIPGPNSTEMAIHIGYTRARWRGLIVAGVAFIAPAALIVLALAWVYVRYGATPAGEALLYGIEPVVVAIVAQALAALGRTATKRSPLLLLAGVSVLALYLAGVNEVALLFGAGLAVLAVRGANRLPPGAPQSIIPVVLVPAVALDDLFLLFVKYGAIIFGSGYVLFAFLRGDIVVRLGWLTEQQLTDALAVGQLTPGPVFTTATFIGYLLGGVGGALLATAGIFVPAFVFAAALRPVVRLMRRRTWTGDILDGVNAAALGLIAGVLWHLGRNAIVDLPTAGLSMAGALVLFRFKVNSGWLVLAGGVAGLLLRLAQ